MAQTLQVPLTRMDREDPELFERILAAVGDVACSGRFILGEEVAGFEEDFARYCGTRFAIGVSSGTDALTLALRAIGVSSGGEVIVPANSFIASAAAVSLAGATPRFVDVDPRTHTVTAETIERAITPRTAAIIVVHLYGRTAEIAPILELAAGLAIPVIEDACQAHGARYLDRRVGGLGACGCFSFYPSKNLGAWGDAGAVTTDDELLAERIRLLRSHGEKPRRQHSIVGTTARLDAIQAAVLRVKLPLLDGWNDARRETAGIFSQRLADLPLCTPAEPSPGGDHVFHQYVVRTPRRDGLRTHLERCGIATAVHYPVPIHRSRAYRDAASELGLPVTERLAGEVCSLPIFPSLTPDTADRIAGCIREFDWEGLAA